MGALEYAIFPHARSPMFEKSFGLANRGRARGWTMDQIKQNILDPNWTQSREPVPDRGHLCADHGIDGEMLISVVSIQIQSGGLVSDLAVAE